MPLLIRGARQVGKTHLVRDFAKSHFENVAEVNFEARPELKKIFGIPDVGEIIRNLGLVLGTSLRPGSTLLFLDEIQECPPAITALRYFYENRADLHVIGAGSLLEFVLSSDKLTMPVGRVEYLYLQPLTFREFLMACGRDDLNEFLDGLTLKTRVEGAVHEKVLEYFKSYLIVGGMPMTVQTYLRDTTSTEFQNIQLSLLQTYRDDFGKYASRVKHEYLLKVFGTAPSMVGKIYKYAQVDRDVQSRELKEALNLLTRAGVITKVLATSGHGLPFIRDAREKKFKILFLDVGLMQRSCGLTAEIATREDFLAANAGTVAEQFVGQQILATRNPRETPELFFWTREKKNSQAKVDFLTVIGSQIVPVEVKAGKTGTLKSLKLFIGEHRSPFGIRFSRHPLSFHDRVLSLPIYAVEQTVRIAGTLL